MGFAALVLRPFRAPETDIRRLVIAVSGAIFLNAVVLFSLHRQPVAFPDPLKDQTPVIMVTLEEEPEPVTPDPPLQEMVPPPPKPDPLQKETKKPEPVTEKTVQQEDPKTPPLPEKDIPPASFVKAPEQSKNPVEPPRNKKSDPTPDVEPKTPVAEEFIPLSRFLDPPAKPRPTPLDKKAFTKVEPLVRQDTPTSVENSVPPSPSSPQKEEETEALEQSQQPSPQDFLSPLAQKKPPETSHPEAREHRGPSADQKKPLEDLQSHPPASSLHEEAEGPQKDTDTITAPEVLASSDTPKTVEESKRAIRPQQSGLQRLLQHPITPPLSGSGREGRPSSSGGQQGQSSAGIHVRGALSPGKSGGVAGIVYDVDCRTPERRHQGCPPLVKRSGEKDDKGWQDWNPSSPSQSLDARYQGLEGEALDRALGNPVAGEAVVIVPGILAVGGPMVDAMRGVNKPDSKKPDLRNPRIRQNEKIPPSITAPDPYLKD